VALAQDFKQQRKQLAHRQRRIIFNNDGCDIDRMEGPKPSDLLAVLTAPLVGSHVDTIFYCTCIGFTLFYHNTELGEILGLDSGAEHRAKRARMVRELIKQGTDPLEVMVDFGQRHDIEVFWSMRMNDEHDQWHPQIIPQFKKDHPEYLFGTQEDRPPHGPWTGVDYARPEIRDRALALIQEVCNNYEIDGLELDFFRQLTCFKSAAWGQPVTQEERDMMTELLRRVRIMTA